ncbi:hypothetical protein DFJ58DRAFT_914132 [Suillus subalutaceus]|uniref:uncharacterized protein n=1 Tax=Suillus subalutaceus TaxID=48586 RepID=UPI001B87B94D|nr:uncharacterized protein DFJ58DRAFT_914132 [Suillus subalutaceus]KAG1853896.1 hypothetical protein DFJ58DRAFT_914132 [Suillus subalutaceus]
MAIKFGGRPQSYAKQLETYFSFVPELAAVSSDNLKGPESIDDIDAEKNGGHRFASDWDVDGKEDLEGRAFDFAELQRVDKGLVPAAIEDEIMVTNNANEDGTWNIDSILLSSGLTSM